MAFDAASRERAQALNVLPSPITNVYREQVVSLNANNRLPTIYGVGAYVDTSGLMSYGLSVVALNRRAAYYVDRILKGPSPLIFLSSNR
jgi:putative ABC transport system substrate-binding protein